METSIERNGKLWYDIQVKIERIKRRISAHEKADNYFDETILGLLDIATQSGYIFEKSSNVDLKRLLLKFVFENITLTEGEISYKLRFPFNEFVNTTILKKKTTKSFEPMQSQVNQGYPRIISFCERVHIPSF